MSYRVYYDRYKELQQQFKISRGLIGLIPLEDRRRMTANEIKVAKDKLMENYDVVIEPAGHGYAHTKYRVLKNKPRLSSLDLAVICDSGNLCFGYRTEGSIICVYTD